MNDAYRVGRSTKSSPLEAAIDWFFDNSGKHLLMP
jgi:hypothetical protein